jgi:Fur family ferric uptake transcriptional regulator
MERTTSQRKAIQSAIEEAGRPLESPRDPCRRAPARPGLGMATVYRAINRLLDDGVLAAVELPGEAPRYERAGLGHHHHFRCGGCNKVFDFFGCTNGFERFAPEGFALERHELFLFGRCVVCATV